MGNKLTPSGGLDKVMTPYPMSRRIVDFLRPRGHILEPFAGEGSFLQAISDHIFYNGVKEPCSLDYCEIDEGRDFYDWSTPVDWIITNPPFSLLKETRKQKSVLRHAFEHAKDVAFYFTIIHGLCLSARRDLTKECGFGVKNVIETDRPKEFPASGFRWGVIHWQKGYVGPQYWHDWTTTKEAVEDAV